MDRRSRRGYIAGLVGAAALSGCQGVLDRSGDSGGSDPDEEDDEEETNDGPAASVETFYAALDAGRFDVANRLMHNESTQPRVTAEQYGNVANGTVSVESTETVERSEEQAVVRTNLRATLADSERQFERTLEIELRTENGEWKLYSVAPAEETPVEEPTEESEPEREESTPETGPVATGEPTTVVTEFYAALNAGDRAAANARLHSEARGIDVTQQAADAMADASLTVENVALVAETGDSATVEATVIVSPAGSDREQTNRIRIELRPENGQWRIYSAGQAG